MSFSTTKNEPWFIARDFNQIKGNNEKEVGKRRFDCSFLPLTNVK